MVDIKLNFDVELGGLQLLTALSTVVVDANRSGDLTVVVNLNVGNLRFLLVTD